MEAVFSENDRWGFSPLHRSGLRLTGPENQDIRLRTSQTSPFSPLVNSVVHRTPLTSIVIRMIRLRFTAINESGHPIFSCLCSVAPKYPGIRSALLALAGSLRVPLTSANTNMSPGEERSIQASQQQQWSSPALERYNSAIVSLRSKISELRLSHTSNDDVIEALGSVLVLVIAGMPDTARPSQSSDWFLHVAGIVSLVESLNHDALQNVPVYRLVREVAAHLDIKAFSLGGFVRGRGRSAWLRWNIASPEELPLADFSPVEVSMGYPRSLVTIIAVLSDVWKCQDAGYVDPSTRDVVSLLYRKASRNRFTASRETIIPDHPDVSGTLEDVLIKLDTVLDLWQHPPLPPRLSTALSLALTTGWEIMRKAAMIYLWRRGFRNSPVRPFPPSIAGTATKFIREMLLSLRSLLRMFDEDYITLMNVMTWPVIVIANEVGRNQNLQDEIMRILLGINQRFGIRHIEHVVKVLRELWTKVEKYAEDNMDFNGLTPDDISLEAICEEFDYCLPLY